VKALGLVRDLFFRSKIDAVALAIGSEVVYASTLEAATARCTEEHPAVVLVDLSDASFPAAETAARLRAVASGTQLIGFASHVDLKALNSAREAGFEMTLSREEFTSRLPELLKG
jgi:DNA-binding NarL/FixJ family response regulator